MIIRQYNGISINGIPINYYTIDYGHIYHWKIRK